MNANWIRSIIIFVSIGFSSGHVAAQTFCSRAKVVGANRVRIEVCQLRLRDDGTYEFVISNYIPTFWGKPSELNPIRTETESGSYHVSGNVIQFFQELPDLDTFALRSVGNRRLKAFDQNGHPNGFTLKRCGRCERMVQTSSTCNH
jgi:hypothetical protein